MKHPGSSASEVSGIFGVAFLDERVPLVLRHLGLRVHLGDEVTPGVNVRGAFPPIQRIPARIALGGANELGVGEEAAFGLGQTAPDAVRFVHTHRELEAFRLHEALRANAFGL